MTAKRQMPMLLKVMIGVFALWIVATVWNGYRKRSEKEDPARQMITAVIGVRDVLRVTTLEGERAVPVTYNGANGTNAFGVGTYRYRISYDIDSLKSYRSGDSLLLIRLPKETVRILEDESEGFRVLDVWGAGFLQRLFGTALTTEDENRMKQMATNRLLQVLETDGTVSKAREKAVATVSEMFSLSVIGGRVVVLPPLEPGTKIDPIASEPDVLPIVIPKEYPPVE